MLKKLRTPFVALLLALSATACKDVETEPRYLIEDDFMWDEADRNATLAGWYLNDIYNYLPGGFNRIAAGFNSGSGTSDGDVLEAGAGDAVPSRLARPVEWYTNGTISVVNNPDTYWASSYAGIRRVNIFLANIDRVPATAATLVFWKAEARFIRAMLYFELVKRYGGVPLIADKVFTLEDNLALPRNNYAECVEYIVSECDAIKGQLRTESAISDADWGRIPRGAAIALKSRILLYAASPLFNGGGASGAGALQGYPSYDASRWQRALDASQELINLNYYALLTSTSAAPAAFNNVFTTKKSTEIILAKQSANSSMLEALNAPIGYTAPTASLGLTSPSQSFVDAFPTLTGLDINAAGSGYNAQNPYANRDPRLLASVFTNGVTTGTTTVGSRWLSRNVETFEGGRDRPGGNAVQTRTGYYLRKFLPDLSAASAYTNVSHNFPIFRYAETRLNAAEALNELGRTEEAVTHIIALRQRAGITAGTPARYGIAVGITQAAARDLIRNERRIELGFEEHRFWDVRRWKIAENVLSGPITGVRIVRGGTAPNYTYTYTYPQVTTMVFQPKLYYMPLPYDEVTKNTNLSQNPGW
ncbi:RagB/SusD family nutrient uptake outer membrane protein [Hymenobacter sp. M29]|uniref:RagB/SusD family nutrient uptake outer membrane protein n=1 Tax=Hymenobacter mellowenesis TaxID=3063995 RepID=A0ABT9A7M1_9BACT|nr:RagB/SusD family nutrient uptake outer membrane protein [Hymenobacter sp. M29]MDO7845523.1 RagB/SusD family nutrient uptake outer membrane protein [Hymenobacter sp. M29]